jgi:hypothetical protein
MDRPTSSDSLASEYPLVTGNGDLIAPVTPRPQSHIITPTSFITPVESPRKSGPDLLADGEDSVPEVERTLKFDKFDNVLFVQGVLLLSNAYLFVDWTLA